MHGINATRTVDVPALTIGSLDATLIVDSIGGEVADMALVTDGRTVAHGADFEVAEFGRWTWLDMPEAEIVETFGSFLAHAIESTDDEARDGWLVLTDEAAEWTDALALYGEGEPVEVEEAARMVCKVNGARFEWRGGAYIDVTPEGHDAPTDCVNVYEYEAGRPTIGTLAEFEAACVEFVREAA